MLEARVLLQHVDVRPEFRFECAAAVGEDSDYRPCAPSILEGRAHAQFGKSRSLLLPDCHLVAALRRPSPRHQREPAAHLVCDRRHAAERSRLELIRRPLHRRVEWHHHLGRKKHRARRVRRDLRPAAQYVRLLTRNVALALGHGAAAENDPVPRLSRQLQALPQAADEAQQDDDHHHDQRDTQRGHQRSRAPDHQASKVVGYRNCSHSNRVKIRRQNQYPPVVAVLGRFSHLAQLYKSAPAVCKHICTKCCLLVCISASSCCLRYARDALELGADLIAIIIPARRRAAHRFFEHTPIRACHMSAFAVPRLRH